MRAALFTGLSFRIETCYQSLSLILTNKGRRIPTAQAVAEPGENVAVAVAPASHMASAN
jgi:hypothetical protein